MSEEHPVTEEDLDVPGLTARAMVVIATVAEGRTDDLDELLVTLRWDDLVTVMNAVADVTVQALALVYGIDHRSPEGRQAVADQARRLAVRELSDDDG